MDKIRYRRCSVCNENKPLDEAHYKRNKRAGRNTKIAYFTKSCSICLNRLASHRAREAYAIKTTDAKIHLPKHLLERGKIHYEGHTWI